MAKMTAFTTLSFQGRQIARAGKQFDGKGLPAQVLKAWAAKGWCSPLPARRAASKSTESGTKQMPDDSIKEMD